MPRWNNSLENNCKDLLDNTIKNIRSNLYQKLLLEVLESGIENNKKTIEKYLRNQLMLPTTLARHTKGYWLSRGWSYDESYVKSKENKQKNCKSIYSQQTWLEKINPITGTNYTAEESDFERNSRRPIRKEYWINKGYTEGSAAQLALDAKSANNKKGADASSTTPIRRITSKRCVDYYISRGYNIEEATKLVSNGQKYFSKEMCIQKYGEADGLVAWQNRQDNWQDTLNAKSPEEKARINRLKLTKGITISKAEKIILEQIKLSISNVTHQFTLTEANKKHYIYDIMANKKIIEYNGDFWHSNPDIYPPNFINPRTKIKAVDKWEIDRVKLQFARDQNYEVLVIWERDFKKNKEEIIKQCIQFLTQ